MENINKAIVRGVGSVDITWDLSAFGTPIDLLSTDEVFVRIENKNDCMILKRCANIINGSIAEIELNATTDIVTMHMTAVERNTMIPNSGYTYKMYVNDELQAYGTFTASGDAPAEYEPPVEQTDGYTQELNCYAGQTLKAIQDTIIDASGSKIYVINFYPGAAIGAGWVANPYIHVNFIGNAARNLDFEDADFTNGMHVLSGLDVTGADFTNATLPSGASTKLTFKDTVGKFSQSTTIWTDGNAIN